MQEIPIPEDWFALRSTVQFLWCSSDRGGFYVANVYFPSGSDNKNLRTEMLRALFEFAASYVEYPVFICGDFQDDPDSSSPIQEAVMTGTWTDLYATQQTLRNLPIEASFTKTSWKDGYSIGCGRTRIDFVLANSKALTLVSDCKYLRGCDFPGHTPVQTSLHCDVFNEEIFVVKPHPRWTFGARPSGPSEWSQREDACQPVLDAHRDCLIGAVEANDAELTWRIACRIATEMLNLISGMQVPASRGRLPAFRKTWVHRAQIKVDSLACAYAKAKKLCRELLFKAARWPSQMNPA